MKLPPWSEQRSTMALRGRERGKQARDFDMKITFKQLTKFIYNLLGLSSWVLANLFMGYTGFVFIELGDTLSRIIGVCMLVAVSASFVMLIMYTFYLTTKKGGA